MIFRVARHTNNLNLIKEFYTGVLNFEILGEFENHDSYHGIFLGKKDSKWHLEFTQTEEPADHHFDEDDILVLYPLQEKDSLEIMKKIKEFDLKIKTSKNPYWEKNGIMIKDPDGYNIIISNQKLNQ